MVNVYRRRAADAEHDWTIFDVPRDGKSLAMVRNGIKKGSKVMTDEHTGCEMPDASIIQ